MEKIIPELISRGYQLVTVSELMYYSGITLEAGKVYYYGK
jgi:peptidoglycan/xylan/chitin deacetylase (PgdA/CDA1 family)